MVGPSVFPGTQAISELLDLQYFQIHGSLKLLDFQYVPVPNHSRMTDDPKTYVKVILNRFSHYVHMFFHMVSPNSNSSLLDTIRCPIAGTLFHKIP